ncbi:DEAD/DEAH box helicase [Mangrovibacterium diazotrophicum]|uniref:Superfamily II DNA/RNA helicase n=1 Tax=Mangrovibacterium diazotrophicum TaxID=1261403 RepID=A0A419W8E2_9BACT|nr:DEAD/DEAH box helicase [Mangrovibacterium diazotrophicum]RKD91743.1 superfamily II DNA/RNA helicase [Mangrovibacterium diazotrophicum]
MKFHDFDLHDDILDALYDMGFDEPTEVQKNTIPIILEGHDLIGCAQTGTGKTAAFMLPIIEKVSQLEAGKTRALIVVPTRELAIQIEQQVQGFSYYAGTTSCAIYGGGDGKEWEEQRAALEKGVDIIVATPGKLISFIDNEIANLKQVEYVVLDEADRMLDIGFHDDIIRIFSHLPQQRQTLMFSATMPPKIRQLAAKVLTNPKEFATAISKPAEGVLQAAYVCHEEQKVPLLTQLITGKDDCQSIIVFSSTKRKVNTIVRALQKKKLDAQGISSDLEQKEREEVLMKFRARQTRILVATDVLSRGIDIKDINLVVNFDVPGDAEDYVHRIGRTARANTTGIALTFVNQEDMFKFQQIESLIESEVFKAPLPPELGEGPEWKVIEKRKGKKKRNFKRNNNQNNNNKQGGKPRFQPKKQN